MSTLCRCLVIAGAVGLLHAQTDDAEFELIAKALQVGEASTVADVGAGSGVFTLMLAERVGPRGRVYGSDVKADLADGIAFIAARKGLKNVVAVVAAHDDPKLPEGCCDAVLMRLVYHALRDPGSTRTGLHRAVKAGGRVLVIDFRPAVPELIAQMGESGFKHVETYERWNGQSDVYGVLFVRSTAF